MVLMRQALENEEYVIKTRRYLHENAEVSGKEVHTTEFIVSELEKWGISVEVVPNGGVIGILEGNQPGKSIILRADIDALPMDEEENNLIGPKNSVSKVKGAAHMCGHDGHTSMLLTSAKILSQMKDKIKGKIIFAFESGEECGAGILNLMDRLLEIDADGAWGIHIQSKVPAGKISVNPGPRMAGGVSFSVKLKGRGGHGSRPDEANNPLDCFVDIYGQLMAMRVKKLNPFYPLTVVIAQVQAGTVGNIIADEMVFNGGMRFLHYKEIGQPAAVEAKRIIETTAEAYDCEVEFLRPLVARGNFIVYNNEQCSEMASKAVEKAVGKEALYDAEPWMASESMSIYLNYWPGVFAFLGTNNPEKGSGADHHNPKFDLDEDVLKIGVASTVQYTIDFLNSDEEIEHTKLKMTPRQIMGLE